MKTAGKKRSIVISVNPTAGAATDSGDLRDFSAALRNSGFEVHVGTHLQENVKLATELHRSGELQALVGMGGDGTMAELLNRTTAGVPLAMYPRGTENLLAKFLGLKNATPDTIAEMLTHGQLVTIDAGRICEFAVKDSSAAETAEAGSKVQPAGSRLFLLMAGCGFDAEVVRRLHESRSGHISHLSYLKPLWHSLRNYDYPEMRISAFTGGGDEKRVFPARWLFVFNCRQYAGGLPILPGADCTDGELDFCAFRHGSAANAFKYLTMVLTGRHTRHKDVQCGRATRIRVESTAGQTDDGNARSPAPVQIDGDPYGWAPVEIECVPKRVTLWAPRSFRCRTASK